MEDKKINISVAEYNQLAIKTAFDKEIIKNLTNDSLDRASRMQLSITILKFMFELEYRILGKVTDDKSI